ncbi:hypothetical protein [Pedobacter sp. SYSU D00535]|uniref:hypothetical protein n=1 Tax=Pedobacter sp. SYSU D00535 TaxID=2810308 RepID=UPI001A97B9D6|nr:hypothetical protein [Pedobacter sp. SYSU D00535]
MKYQLDLKSTAIGFASAFLLTAIISFKNSADSTNGRYQTAVHENKVVILDTKTGAYIMESYISPKATWIRGNFESKRMAEAGAKND